jgi:hypothetical protein
MTSKTFTIAAGLISASLLGTAAFAQTAWVEVDDQAMVAPFDANADTVDDWDVHAADGTKIGDIEEVLGTDAQTATALVVDFDGKGGYQDRDVVIPLDQFTWSDNRLVLNADVAAVDAMEVYND